MVRAVAASRRVEVGSRDQAAEHVDRDSMVGTLVHVGDRLDPCGTFADVALDGAASVAVLPDRPASHCSHGLRRQARVPHAGQVAARHRGARGRLARAGSTHRTL